MLTSEHLSLFLKALVSQIVSIRAEGIEHVPREGGALLVCNHADLLDGLLLGLFSGRRVFFPGRKEVQDSPIFGTINRVFQEVHERLAPDSRAFDLGEDLLDLISQLLLDLGRMYPFTGKWLPAPLSLEDHHDSLAELLSQGQLVAVFPAPGFTRGRKTGTFDSAVGRLLLETRVPLIPAALYGTYGLSDMTRWVSGRNRGRTVIFRIGAPVSPDRLPVKLNKNSARIWTGKMEEKVERLLRTAGKKKAGKPRPGLNSRGDKAKKGPDRTEAPAALLGSAAVTLGANTASPLRSGNSAQDEQAKLPFEPV